MLRASRVLAHRAGIVVPETAPTRVLMRVIRESGPITTEKLWERVTSENLGFKSKNFLKTNLRFLKDKKRIAAKKSEDGKTFAYKVHHGVIISENIARKKAAEAQKEEEDLQ